MASRRTKTIDRPFEVKTLDEETGRFVGYGSVFGELDSYRDIVLPGAFTKSIAQHAEKNRRVKMLWNHDTDEPIGVYLSVKEDQHGLLVEGEINLDVQRGQETLSLMKQGAIDGLSIGYNVVFEEYNKETYTNYLKEVNLWEISPVVFPAGDSARVTAMKGLPELTTLSDIEDYMREAYGLSKKEATAHLSRFKSVILSQRDAGNTKDAVTNALKNINFN